MQLLVFVLMNIICWFCFRYLYENNFKKTLPRLLGHAINFIWFLIMAILGYIGFLKDNKKWKKNIWLYAHLCVLVFLMGGGIIEKLQGKVFAEQFRDLFGYTRGFFTTPLPFLILWVLPSILQYSLRSTSNKVS